MPDQTADSWAGWMRSPGRPWRVVCCAVSEEACWDLLLAEPGPASSDRCVLARGRTPARKARAR